MNINFQTLPRHRIEGALLGNVLGRFELNDEFEADCNLRLSLDNGIFSGTLRGLGGGEHAITAFVARTDDLFCLRLSSRPARTMCPCSCAKWSSGSTPRQTPIPCW